MKKIKILKPFLLLLGVMSICGPVDAQRRNRETELTISGTVVDEAGAPLMNAAVTAGAGSLTVYTDAGGRYNIKNRPSAPLVFEREGYETRVVYLAQEGIPTEMVLTRAAPFTSSKDVVNRGDGSAMLLGDIVGAVGKADVDRLEAYPDLSLSNALQGSVSGLIARPGNGGFGQNSSALFVRGQHSLSNSVMIVVDGIPRGINNMLAEEIESIEVLKDVTAKMLYGASAADGVVLVTTKRGREGLKTVRASAEYGVFRSAEVPEFLGSHEYATLYNQARANDGLAPRYTEAQLQGYANSTGENDPLYPDVDWYGKFLRRQSPYAKATVEFSGGNRSIRYAMVAGFTSGRGLENVGRRTSMNQINVRGNLDIRISRMVTFRADVAGRIFDNKWSLRNQAAIMTAISTNKPNEYPLTVTPEFMGMESESGVPFFGGSTRVVNNLLADLVYSGNNEQRDTHSQMNIGLDLNMNHLVRGLSAEAFFSFDDYNSLTQRLESTYPTYSIRESFDAAGTSNVEIEQLKRTSVSTSQNISANSRGRVMGVRGNVAWNGTFDRHHAGAVLATRYFQQEFSGLTQDFRNMSTTLRLNYDFDRKYFAELDLGYMGSNVYTGAEKFMIAPAAGIAWMVSKESFMGDVRWLDHLKVKASAGVMGSEAAVVPVAHSFSWVDGGTWTFGEANGSAARVLNASVLGNPDLKWEKQREVNVGVEMMALSRRLSAEVNWFSGKRTDIVTRNNAYSAALGDFYWYENVADVTNRGIDAYVKWSERHNRDLAWSAGVNVTWSKNRVDRIDEGAVEAYRSRVGKPTSANVTLRYAGMFGPAASGMIDPAGHPFQTFGPVQAGDLAYRDINGDDIVDGRDREMIGQSFPLTSWGVDFNVDYRGFGLFVLGTAETGVQKLASSNYYHNYGENGYSVLARDAYHALTNPTGSQPRLSTSTDVGNNWRESEFWYRDCSFFRLKNVELSYTFRDMKNATFFSYLKLFVRGTNLFVVTPIKGADPERILAGVDNYPVYRAFTGGVSITF